MPIKRHSAEQIVRKLGPDDYVPSGGTALFDAVGRGIDLIERWPKAKFFRFSSSDRGRVLVRDPARIDAVHVDPVFHIVLGGRSRQHVERRLGHVGVRVLVALEGPIKLALHR